MSDTVCPICLKAQCGEVALLIWVNSDCDLELCDKHRQQRPWIAEMDHAAQEVRI